MAWDMMFRFSLKDCLVAFAALPDGAGKDGTISCIL